MPRLTKEEAALRAADTQFDDAVAAQAEEAA